MLRVLGTALVVTGACMGIIGMLGAIGAGLQLGVTPRRAVRRAKDVGEVAGRTMVHGRAAPGPGGVYVAPLSGLRCVWYLASQSAVRSERRQTEDRYPAQPFVIDDGTGRVLVGPRCPALEQIPPSYREVRDSPHPWFGGETASETASETAVLVDRVEVFEFLLAAGSVLTASGEVLRDTDGRPRLGGDVALSFDEPAAAGDPARYKLRRDVTIALAGLLLVFLGALAL